MKKEKTVEELIAEFERTYFHIVSLYPEISYHEGLRHVSGLVPKNNSQKELERELEEKSFSAEQLKNEIVQRLGAEVETAKMELGEFYDFLNKR